MTTTYANGQRLQFDPLDGVVFYVGPSPIREGIHVVLTNDGKPWVASTAQLRAVPLTLAEWLESEECYALVRAYADLRDRPSWKALKLAILEHTCA